MAASRRLRRRITTLPMHKDLLQGEHLRSDDHSEFHKIRKKNSPLVGDVSLRWCVSLDLFRGSVDQLTEIVSDCLCSTEQFDTTIYSGDVDVKYLFRSIGDKSLIYY